MKNECMNDNNDTNSGKPVVKLVGENGNAFNIMARCKNAAKVAGWDKSRIDALIRSMFNAGSYDEVLQIALEHFEVE
jgi:hypothetical protein